MKLVESFKTQVDADIRRRGLAYYNGGRVSKTRKTDTEFTAWVRGTNLYRVSLVIDDGGVGAVCTCPYFSGGDSCKHIWATILAADAVGFGRGLELTAVDEDETDWEEDDAPASAVGYRGFAPAYPPVKRTWRDALNAFAPRTPEAGVNPWPANRQIVYQVRHDEHVPENGALVVAIRSRDPRLKGGWCKARRVRVNVNELTALPDSEDREILAALCGGRESGYWGANDHPLGEMYRLNPVQIPVLFPRLIATGRCLLLAPETEDDGAPLVVDPDETPWRFTVTVTKIRNGYRVDGSLQRGDEQHSPKEAAICLKAGWVVWPDARVSRLDAGQAFDWLLFFRHGHAFDVPTAETNRMLAALFAHAHAPPLQLPAELQVTEHAPAPSPCVRMRPPRRASWGGPPAAVPAELVFDYAGQTINPFDPATAETLFRADVRAVTRRNMAAEQLRMAEFAEAGFSRAMHIEDPRIPFEVAAERVPRAVLALLEKGWRVESAGKPFRRAGALSVDVTSGVDWFDVRVRAEFEGVALDMPALLAAVMKKDRTVVLGDGSLGMLTDDVLKKLVPFLGMGNAEAESIRFKRNQSGILDALLAAQPEATCDATFRKVREELRTFTAVAPVDAPPGFCGTLRPYQREGLGWLQFLQRFGFGGCLADDMGLGKTVQVLALLEQRRAMRAAGQPELGRSLVVVPRSLVFNWKQEAGRFAPQLKILDHTGTYRARDAAAFGDCDVVLTTYGTLRKDIAHFKDCVFDYVVLDEAQAIKNAGAQTAKATRLLQARHRLAMSGTPIQNHMGDLWSLFDFLNPGMLGTSTAFRVKDLGARDADPALREMLARALKPFILRRTKAQVARDLPERTEETVYCEMEAGQRKEYDKLKLYYQQSLLARVEKQGLNKSKMHVLEALLRLRQAACHVGLLDPARLGEGSAKLDVLLDQLDEVTEGGHKALVFSQFTSFLAIVRARLDARGIAYEYLDGKTKDRQAPVERFQKDDGAKLFLISLKAGGLGLNLTAAEYVFLLDPWWNPAVEAQAVDRAHRIGQTRHVFAYRLIAKDTVEEKVLELQKTKRALADSIVTADNSLIRTLTREDLELLLA